MSETMTGRERVLTAPPGGTVGSSSQPVTQCGRDTPLENIREMVRVAKEFGIYPLDLGRIEDEIARLEQTGR